MIWGIVIYRIFAGMSDDDTNFSQTQVSKYIDIDSVSETYSLIASYRDPFLGKSYVPKSINTNSSIPKPPKKAITPAPKPIETPKPIVYIDWSFIQYNGLISNKGTSKLVGLVKIKGTDHIVNVNSTIGDVKITFLSKDSVGILFQQQKKMFGRQ